MNQNRISAQQATELASAKDYTAEEIMDLLDGVITAAANGKAFQAQAGFPRQSASKELFSAAANELIDRGFVVSVSESGNFVLYSITWPEKA